ncbi:GtrA family protein [Albimonas sp. CAU 1670]|uniref:GtrA family protein n=1 Tax=Albimonas sp. CAU 1670 TaxID=3032599 RepID=UPI0023DA26B9|nr:GtrA family protein [Albimonas sp. CAU 1670]MDF2234593.1 GtrA family protein [Albimonas sp. CAU 1670]
MKRIDPPDYAAQGDAGPAGFPAYGRGGLRRGPQLTALQIAVRYVAFAVLATVCNLAAQRLVLSALRQQDAVAFGWAPDLLDWVLDDLLGVVAAGGRLGWRAEWQGPLALILAIGLGTAVGLVVKYLLDKRWIFFDRSTGAKAHARRFALYTLMGVATTAIFWGSEALAWWLWRSDLARETGAVLGLMVGYVAKYQFDRRFVFTPSDRPRRG